MTRTLGAWFRPTVIYALVALFLLWTVAPVAWIATMSVQPEINYISVPPHLRWQDTSFRWFSTILKDPAYTNALRTSFIVATATMIVCLVLGSLAAYPLARLKLPFKGAFLVFTVATRMVPAIVLIIPMFLLIRNLHLLDTYAALIVVYTTFLLPYVIWMLKNFFEQIPYSLEAAARMDGCSRLGALFRVIIPVSAPGVVATAIFSFIGAWNEFLFGLILSNKVAIPITVRLSGLVGGTFHTDNSLVAATGILAIAPVVALVFILNRFIVRGLVEGVKY
ncbi:MAG: carbohydrate ABC transporter permease [Thermomicrobiales bacterium]|jgi:ABC-type glycerol-3-phosphate transport system permease component|nr:carbohydrate ABC transporter permease [Thermomicrobiales bacterium]